MDNFVGKFFKGASSVTSSITNVADADFADFATPSPATPDPAAQSAASASPVFAASSTDAPGVGPAFVGPWYAIWERHSINEFQNEGFVLVLIIVIVIIHLWGTRRNRSAARNFIKSISSVLTKEFAMVGFDSRGKPNTMAPTEVTELGSGPGSVDQELDFTKAVQEKSTLEFVSYATGRNNIAFMHTTINLVRRNNPFAWIGELFMSFFLDSIPAPADRITMTIAPFDGGAGGASSKYDNFIWAAVNKRQMRRWRDERYDMSLTRTSDWEGLPNWLAIMGESKEVGDLVLQSSGLKDVLAECSDFLDFLIVTDQPKEKPIKLEETVPKKRITLQITLPAKPETLNRLVQAFVRLVDHLAAHAHFRPEVTKKIKATRDDASKRLRRQQEEEKAEEREQKRAEDKKAERDAKLARMTAAEQKKFLEKEREKDARKMSKKQTKRG